ncbi:uncharacterized protein BP5553_08838 [Venustampulla echinocandica]|uniref:Uncharacterized protein n=1 Tax=Venustampulla echinocandica TaxID=2656787 RepID=A0A370TD46_9HELO|nr:uncharacterized protein BP5553_08838 [Venustampulla echinocandica]RDL32382.1 hypothetical protein BP5553_08838 [Venustampulla echinocandica]
MNYRGIEIFLYKPALHSNPISIGFNTGNSQRMDMLHSCLVSAKSLLDPNLEQPLSVYNPPPPDLTYVLKTISTYDYFDRIIANLDKVGALIDQSLLELCRNPFPTGCANAMRRIKSVYEAKVAAEQARNSVVFEGVGINGDQMDWLDDAYWQELLNDGTFLQYTAV